MKKVKGMWVLAFIITAGLSIMSCTKDTDLNNEVSLNQMADRIESGTWKITLFAESGRDETSHFSGYEFTFNTDGLLLAQNGANAFEGTWSITDSNSNDDSPGDLHFNIHFNLTNELEDLNDDWEVLSSSDIKMELTDVSGGNGGTDYLTLEKK